MKRLLTLVLAILMAMSVAISASAEARVTWGENPEPVTLKLFADCTWLPYDSFDGIIPQWIEEQTGIKLELTKATDSNQIVLMVAGGDIPYDLVMTDSSTMFREMSSSDMCYAFDELIAQYVPNWEVPEVTQNMNRYYSSDEHYYMLKNYFNTVDEINAAGSISINTNGFYFRRDIFDTLGIETVPTTLEGVMEMLAKVKEQYPDMTPMVFQHRNYNAFASFAGLDVDFPTDAEGNLVYVMSDPNFKEFYSAINQMYRAGYISKENFSFNSDEQMYQFMTDGTGFMFASFGLDESVYNAYVQSGNAEASLQMLPLMDNYKRTFAVSGWAGCFIPKSCSNPEAAIKLIAFMKDGDNRIAAQAGVYGTDWTWDENGVFQALDRYNEAKAAGAIDQTYTGVGFLLSASDYISEGKVGYSTASDNVKAILDDACARSNFSNLVGLAVPESNSDEAIIKTNLDDLKTEYFPIVCMAESDEEFEAKFTEMMDEAEKIGLSAYNAWLSAKYVSLCEEFGGK